MQTARTTNQRTTPSACNTACLSRRPAPHQPAACRARRRSGAQRDEPAAERKEGAADGRHRRGRGLCHAREHRRQRGAQLGQREPAGRPSRRPCHHGAMLPHLSCTNDVIGGLLICHKWSSSPALRLSGPSCLAVKTSRRAFVHASCIHSALATHCLPFSKQPSEKQAARIDQM